ncbi:MAG: putative Ig domain-containing protein [Gammaproteobacteria bacterium]|nr:putative Ig domain-containing protein [Gammaproteobacteria bacterium]
MDENAGGAVVTSVATENATSVTVDEDNEERFEVADGNLKLKEGQKLDFESDTSPIEVVITASGDGESDTHTVSVSVNDVNEAPTITVAAMTTEDAKAGGVDPDLMVPEDSDGSIPGAVVAHIALDDPDAGDAEMLTLAVSDDRFETTEAFGQQWLKLKEGQTLDFETEPEIKLTVTVADDGTPAESTTSEEVTIKVTDVNEAPAITVAAMTTPEAKAAGVDPDLTVDEDSDGTVPGGVVAHIALDDPDAGDKPTFGVSDERFEAIEAHGQWWLRLKEGQSLDHETESTIPVTVTVTDAGGLTAAATVTITVNDVNEAPEVNAEEAEKIPVATFVSGKPGSREVDLKALFSDPDGDGLTYSLTYSLTDEPEWLKLSVTTEGSGDDLTIKGTVSGTPPDDAAEEPFKVSIVASDRPSGGLTAEASFDVVVDKENAEPIEVYLRRPAADGQSDRVSEVPVKENAPGFVLGRLYVTDEDNDRHPHGQHEFSFSDDRFEEDDGMLKLKEGKFLDFEEDGAELVLEVTATDNEGAEDEDDRKSVSAKITIKVGNEGDAPTAEQIGNWWVTVDEDLDAADVGKGRWLAFDLSDTAFDDDDGDKLEYIVRVTDDDGEEVDLLEISSAGRIENRAKTPPPERGVYTVTVTADDDDDDTDSISVQFKLAVALSDDVGLTGDVDGNGDPKIDVTEENDYTEQSGEQLVAKFSVDDEDIAIAPHPYGVLHVDFTATQEDKGDVTNRLKLVPKGKGSDGESMQYEMQYEIWTKSADELAVGADGKKLKTALKPLGFEIDEDKKVEITVKVWDNFRYKEVKGEDGKMIKPFIADEDGKLVELKEVPPADTAEINFDIVDVDNTKPKFDEDEIHSAGADADEVTVTPAPAPAKDTTTITVPQQGTGDLVIVVPLEDAWDDGEDGTDSNELIFGKDDEDINGLDWIKVYGPREWEKIYENPRTGVDDGDAPSGLGDSEEAVAIVIDRTAGEDGDNVGTGTFSFKLTATDGEGNTATETINVKVTDTNVDISADAEDVVEIVNKDEANGLGSLNMAFDEEKDPDFVGDAKPVLVLYTWKLAGGVREDDTTTVDVDESMERVISVSTTPESLPLAARGARRYEGEKIIAEVEYYEMDPISKRIVLSDKFSSEPTAVIKAPDEDDADARATFDFTTDASGLSVDVTIHNAAPTSATATLQVSTSGTGGWTNVAGQSGTVTLTANPAGTSSSGTFTRDVDGRGDGSDTEGDGGGYYYRVVLSYGSGSDVNRIRSDESDGDKMVQLGQLDDPDDGEPDDGETVTNIINGAPDTAVSAGTLLEVDAQDNDIKVQWQFDPDGSGGDGGPRGWMDIAGADDTSIRVTGAHHGGDVRAKVTYRAKEDDPDTALNEKGAAEWIEYTEIIGVEPAQNQVPVPKRDDAYEVRVEPKAKQPMKDQPGTVRTFSVKDLFFYDGDSKLSYVIADVSPDLDDDARDTVADGSGTGYAAEIFDGGQVYRSYTTTITTTGGDRTEEKAKQPHQTLTIDDDGNVTYITNAEGAHDGTPVEGTVAGSDGARNRLAVDIHAYDDPAAYDPDDSDTYALITLDIRINVAPSAIELTSVDDDESATPVDSNGAADGLAIELPAPGRGVTGVPLVLADGGDDADTDPDTLIFMDDEEQEARIVANINVVDQNEADHAFGDHEGTTLSGMGSDQFEVVETRDDDSDLSTWQIRLKDDATFDFEKLKVPQTAAQKTAKEKVLSITVTAKDGGGLETMGVFSVVVMNDTDDDPDDDDDDDGGDDDPKLSDPTVEGLEDDDTDEGDDKDFNSEDGPAIMPPPKDGGAFLDDDDLLGDFVLAIDDGIDIA